MMKISLTLLAVALCIQSGASRSLSQLPVLGSPASSIASTPAASPAGPLTCAAAALAEAGNYGTLLQLVEAASESQLILELLNSSEERATVLAPTDDGITKTATANNINLDDLLSNPEQITDILLYHVLPSQLNPTDFVDGYSFNTLYELDSVTQSVAVQGNGLSATVVGAGSSAAITGSLTACEFRVYPLDGLLLPPN